MQHLQMHLYQRQIQAVRIFQIIHAANCWKSKSFFAGFGDAVNLLKCEYILCIDMIESL